MGWFDEQIKQRKQSDDQLLEEAFVRIADAVLGTKLSAAYLAARIATPSIDALHTP